MLLTSPSDWFPTRGSSKIPDQAMHRFLCQSFSGKLQARMAAGFATRIQIRTTGEGKMARVP
jgi:hypothetical protein